MYLMSGKIIILMVRIMRAKQKETKYNFSTLSKNSFDVYSILD